MVLTSSFLTFAPPSLFNFHYHSSPLPQSGKLVMKMFQHIQNLVADENSIVFVLIDEVESLTAARTAAMSGSEPSDAIRVVNALLTQIDLIKR